MEAKVEGTTEKKARGLPCWLIGHRPSVETVDGKPSTYRETCGDCEKTRTFEIREDGRHNIGRWT